MDLETRNVRVKMIITQKLDAYADMIKEAEETIAYYQNASSHIRQAVKQEQWHKLTGILAYKDIESLSETSPINLLEEA
jgi:hypothetical protein